MSGIDELRAVPPSRWAAGAVAAALVLVVIGSVVASGGEGSPVAEFATTPATAIPTTASSTATTSPATTSPATSSPATTVIPTSVATTSTVAPPTTTIDLSDYAIEVDDRAPAVAGRLLPDESAADRPPPTTVAPPPWAASTFVTDAGHVSTDVGCVDGLGHSELDAFFADRVGPVLGWDYQHVYELGGDRHLWLFQDAFLDHSGTVQGLGDARFVHNAALVQEGGCFRLLHRGSPDRPSPFEIGDGTGGIRSKWWWPLGGELAEGRLWVFWAEMVKDPYDPDPPDGLGWHPNRTFLASYDAETLERRSFSLAPASGVTPIYGYAVSSDATHTYLFGNTFEQNFIREGGFWNGPHSATHMHVARVPRGLLTSPPEYWSATGWTPVAAESVPILSRFWAENPMQPRYLDGQWVAVTAVDGYWGDHLAVDVADSPTGPWSTVVYEPLVPRGSDPLKNTYHAHLLPWRDGFGSVLISVSNNARNMRRDAWNSPDRYRPMVIFGPFAEPPPPTTSTTTTSTTTTSTPITTTTTSTTTSTTTTSTTTPSTTTSTTTSSTTSPTSSTSPSTTTTTSSTTTLVGTTTTTGPATTSTSVPTSSGTTTVAG